MRLLITYVVTLFRLLLGSECFPPDLNLLMLLLAFNVTPSIIET